MVYEKGGLTAFKKFLFISHCFVVPSLNVAITNDLGCVPFFFSYVVTFRSKCHGRVLQSLVDKVSQMLQHCKECCDIIFDAQFNLCRDTEKSMSRQKMFFSN